MNIFQTHASIMADYATYMRSFLNIAEPTSREQVEGKLSQSKLWPCPSNLLRQKPTADRPPWRRKRRHLGISYQRAVARFVGVLGATA
jgi:hypothetical protein